MMYQNQRFVLLGNKGNSSNPLRGKLLDCKKILIEITRTKTIPNLMKNPNHQELTQVRNVHSVGGKALEEWN